MAFDFRKLPKRAQRAAFAKMSTADKAAPATPLRSKSLGSGARHAQLSANRANGSSGGQPSPEYVRTGRPSDSDINTLIGNYRAMHGRDPSPKQIARLRRARR